MANISFRNPEQIIQAYQDHSDMLNRKVEEMEHNMYDKLTTDDLQKMIGGIINRVRTGDFDEADRHALHLFFEAYIKNRMNPAVITHTNLPNDDVRKARLVEVFQKHGYDGADKPINKARIKDFMETKHAYPGEKDPHSLSEQFGECVEANHDFAVFQKPGEKPVAVFRGSREKLFDPNFVEDWAFNAKAGAGSEATAKATEKYKRVKAELQKVMDKYRLQNDKGEAKAMFEGSNKITKEDFAKRLLSPEIDNIKNVIYKDTPEADLEKIKKAMASVEKRSVEKNGEDSHITKQIREKIKGVEEHIENVDRLGGAAPFKEFIGFSQGGGLAIHYGDEFGVPTTTFNAHINALHNLAETNVRHQVWRTAEDPATLFLAYKKFNDNVKIGTLPSLDNYDNAMDSHRMANFTDLLSGRSKNCKIHRAMNRIKFK